MVNSSSPDYLFQQRAQFFTKESERVLSTEKALAWLRVLAFLGCLLFLFSGLRNTNLFNLYLGLSGFFFLTFLFLLKFHDKIKAKRIFLEQKARLNDDVGLRRELNLKPFPTGEEFISNQHPYTSDLDIFGDFSLFQLINQSRSVPGKEKLAKWLAEPAAVSELQGRQNFVLELLNELDFRQDVLAYGSLAAWDAKAWDAFKSWIATPQLFMSAYSFIMALFIALVHVTALGLWYYGWLAFWWLPPVFLPGLIFLYQYRARIKDAQAALLSGQNALHALAKSIAIIEKKYFKSEWGQLCQSQLKNASQGISELASLAFRMENRGNAIYSLLNVLLLLDIHQWRRLQLWRTRYEARVSDWLDGYASMEAILSLAGLKDSFPEWVLPEWSDLSSELSMIDGGHPLIPSNERVVNSLSLHKGNRIGLITGSNMAGKSTFLRTVGVNLVLAQAGAPVCARQFRTSYWRLFTGMRVGDDLQAKTSSFFAELKRIRQLLLAAAMEGKPPVFFLLDEVLKGTNSADRHAGARGLIHQLSLLNTAGLISTHDVELVDLEKSVESLKNFSFHSDVVDGQLHFDYQLKEGPCPQFNAADLMAMMGIQTHKPH